MPWSAALRVLLATSPERANAPVVGLNDGPGTVLDLLRDRLAEVSQHLPALCGTGRDDPEGCA